MNIEQKQARDEILTAAATLQEIAKTVGPNAPDELSGFVLKADLFAGAVEEYLRAEKAAEGQ